jgi:hypothetical protein
MLLNNKKRLDMRDVILSGAKDLTVGTRVCFNQLKINEAEIIRGSWKILPTDEWSLASLGMTE